MADCIIIVDTDPITRKTARDALSKAAVHVTELKSGQELLDHVLSDGIPDLVLLDMELPDLSGFEIIRRFQKILPESQNVPVVFLMEGDAPNGQTEDMHGVLDVIQKPLDPEVLVSRVKRTLNFQKEARELEKRISADRLTGFWNKTATNVKMTEMCRTEKGFLCLFDLDSFGSFNDLYGHEAGDQLLIHFSELLIKNMEPEDVCGRIGGDEFIVFLRHPVSEDELESEMIRLNRMFSTSSKKLLGDKPILQPGVSVGAVKVPQYGTDYTELFQMADQAMRYVKENGKHSFKLYSAKKVSKPAHNGKLDLDSITRVMEEKNDSLNAMWMGKEAFGSVYRYMVRYMSRYHGVAYRVLFTNTLTKHVDDEERSVIMAEFRSCMSSSLRNSDIMMECGENQLFFLLPEIQEYDINHVINRLIAQWKHSPYSENTVVTYECGRVQLRNQAEQDNSETIQTIALVDDVPDELQETSDILTLNGFLVASLHSGKELIAYLHDNKPALILLDLKMKDMDGFGTLRQMRDTQMGADVPVIFLTADTDPEKEAECFKIGGMDFIRKPVVSEVLIQRVKHTIELIQLQRNLAATVERKSQENEKLSLHVVQTLARTIDAKDPYTNGHSTRVAAYAKEIARRCGYTEREQSEIFMMGLLHDVGKIGVPDSIINKKGKLTEEEYTVIQSHPKVGANILEYIEEMPRLSEGARWHHEWYNGSGYPDHLSGDEIPEQARIIAVADAYDAMSSRRIYRDIMNQEDIRREIRNGRGTQFDPVFADVMLQMIEEDKEFKMREIK